MVAQNTTTNMQAFLDSLSQLPGSILYRDPISWVALPPGQQGEILTIDSEHKPFWSGTKFYRPAMMDFGQSGSGFTRQFTVGANKITCIGRIVCPIRAGVLSRWLIFVHNGFISQRRLQIIITDAGLPGDGNRMYFLVRDNSDVLLCSARSGIEVSTAEPVSFHFAYDGSTGDGTLTVNGVHTDPTVGLIGTPRTGTLNFDIAAPSVITQRNYNGQLGYFGYKEEFLPEYSDFFDENNRPLIPNESTWPQWNGQPLVWHEAADLNKNWGSIGNFNRVVNPYVGKGGNL